MSGPEIARSSRWSVTSASPPARSGRSQRAMRSAARPAARRRGGGRGGGASFVVQRVEHVEPRGPARRDDRRGDAGEHRDERERDQHRRPGSTSRRRTATAPGSRAPTRKIPSGSPSAAPISAVITLSWRIIRRACRRVMPIVRSMPSSRVRSNTESTSVLTIPNSETTTENASITYSRFRKLAKPCVYSCANASPVCSLASLNGSAAAFSAGCGARLGVEEREPVLGLRERLVERLLGDRDHAEHLVDLRRVVDAAHGDRALVARRALDLQPLADRRRRCRRRRPWPHRVVDAQRRHRAVVALDPVERVELVDRRRVDAGHVGLLARRPARVGAHVRGRRHAVDRRERVALGGAEGDVVAGVEDVAGLDLVGDRALDRGAQARRRAPRRP